MNISVKLMAHTPEPTRMIALAARLCYTKGMTIQDLDKKTTDEYCERMVRKVVEAKHHSCLEHAVFTFGVEGVSRNFSHQMVRHRNTSYEQQSLHYLIANDGFNLATPPNMNPMQTIRWNQAKRVAFATYEEMIKEGIPREEARHILPSGIETKIVITANVRQWLHFVKLRICVVNCHEITVVAHKIKNILMEKMPVLESELGPTCHTEGVCYEGKKFCNAPWKLPCKVKGGKEDYTVENIQQLNEIKEAAKNDKN